MNDFFVNVWIIVDIDGIIFFFYCLGCKVGFVELCLYVVSVMIYIECWVCVNGKMVCM